MTPVMPPNRKVMGTRYIKHQRIGGSKVGWPLPHGARPFEKLDASRA